MHELTVFFLFLDGKICLFHRSINITFMSYPLMADIDECAQGNPCTDTHSECKNVDGSYNCQCKDGFEKKDGICEGAM